MSQALPAKPAHRTWPTTLALALLTLLVCRLWTTGIWHGLDAYQLLGRIEQGILHNDRHPLYPFLARAVGLLLTWVGMPWFDAVVAASSFGVALGVVGVHRALLVLELPARDAAMAAAAVAGCYGILYYGTVIEIHGPFFAFAGAAWWAFARWRRHRGAAWALGLGVATGLAASAHATGHLLLGTCALFALAWRRPAERPGSFALPLLLVAIAHFAVAVTLSYWTGATVGRPFDGPIRYLDRMLSLGTDWQTALQVCWREWLQPYLPISVLGLLAWRRDLRPAALALWLAVLVYLAATVVLLSPAATVTRPEYMPPFATIEYGAYFMPLAVPAAVLALRLLPARSRILLPVAAVACGIWGLGHPDRDPGDPGFGRDALAVIDRDHARLLCGGYDELDPIMRLRPRTIDVVSVYALQIEIAGRAEGTPYEYVTGWFDVQYQQVTAAGGQWLVTASALALLAATRDGLLSRLATEHIPQHYDLTPVAHGHFRALRARPKA